MSAPPPEPQAAAATPAAKAGVELVGQTVDKSRVLRVLGRGGMGAVYEAVHEMLGQRIAIKVLKSELSSDARHVQRFFDEARAVNIVQHPGLIKVFDFGHLPDGTAYITMELLAGETLQERLSRLHDRGQRMDLVDALRIVRQVASALESVHAKGIAHRDLKPANLFLVSDPESPSGERAKILDFGIAKFYDQGKAAAGGEGDVPHHLTTVGKLLGTPAYMAPEQCSGAEHLDDSIDVYALGVILYQLLAGRLPFEAQVAVLIMTKHITEAPPPLSPAEHGLPPPLCELVHEMLAKDRKLRPSMAQVVVRLEQLLEAETGASSQQWRSQHRRRWSRRRRWLPYAAIAGVVLASVLLISIGKKRRAERRGPPVATQPVAAPPSAPTPAPAPEHVAPPAPAPVNAPPAAAVAEVPRPAAATGRKRTRGSRVPAREGAAPAPATAVTPGVDVPILR